MREKREEREKEREERERGGEGREERREGEERIEERERGEGEERRGRKWQCPKCILNHCCTSKREVRREKEKDTGVE